MARWLCCFLLGLLLAAAAVRAEAPLQENRPQPRRPLVALALSGGGARGGAHVGVLKRLEEAGLPIDVISGTSFGALVGGLYAVGYSAADIKLIIERVDWNELFEDAPDRRLLTFDNKRRADRRLFRLGFENLELQLPTGLQPGQKVRQLLDRLTVLPVLEADNDFDRLPVRFRAVATDILTGRPHVFDKGPMSGAIRASIAVPGLFTPVEHAATLLVDGGLARNIPVDEAFEAGADLVIAVDVSSPLRTDRRQIGSILDILDQAISIHIEENKDESLQKAHIVITPELDEFSSADFAKAATLFQLGYEAAEDSLPVIRQLLAERSVSLSASALRQPILDAQTFNLSTYQWSDSRILVDSVKAEGLKKYPQAARETVQAGEEVTLNEIDSRVSRLYGTDLFERVHYRIERAPPNTILTFEFQESAQTEVGVGIRYDRDYNFTGSLDLVTRDFLGSRSDLVFRGLVGEARGAEVEFNSPTVSAHRLIFSPRAYFRSYPRFVFQNGERVGEFSDERAGFQVGVRYLLSNRGQLEAVYQLDRINIARGLGNFSQANPEKIGLLRLGLRMDTLDDWDFPSRGWRGRFLAENANSGLGGERSFTRLSSRAERYFALEDGKSTLGVKGFWGLIKGTAPFYERFYTGGVQYLSFSAEPFVGLARDEIVSDHLLTAGLSYRRQVKSFQLGFLKAVYLGAEYQGGLFNEAGRLLEFRGPLHGVGGGLYLDTRFFGPIRILLGGTDRKDFNAYVSFGRFF